MHRLPRPERIGPSDTVKFIMIPLPPSGIFFDTKVKTLIKVIVISVFSE